MIGEITWNDTTLKVDFDSELDEALWRESSSEITIVGFRATSDHMTAEIEVATSNKADYYFEFIFRGAEGATRVVVLWVGGVCKVPMTREQWDTGNLNEDYWVATTDPKITNLVKFFFELGS